VDLPLGTLRRKLAIAVADDVAAVRFLDMRTSRGQGMSHPGCLQGVFALAADIERRSAERRSRVITPRV